MPRLLLQSVATVRGLARDAIATMRGTFPGSTTFPGGGAGGTTYPATTTYPGAARFPGGGLYLYPGNGSSLGAIAASTRILTETSA